MFRKCSYLFLGGVALVAVAWFVDMVSDARDAARYSNCKGQLTQLGLALFNYHDVYEAFPPAFVADANGKPMHSWRVLILQFIEPQLYFLYDFSQPWNGLENSKLADKLQIGQNSTIYNCPSAAPNGSLMTNYVAIVGPETVWPGSTSMKVPNVRNFDSKTILLVEIANSNIHWMEPRDLSLEDALAGLNNATSVLRISSRHKGPPQFLAVHFNVETFPQELTVEQLKAMVEPDWNVDKLQK